MQVGRLLDEVETLGYGIWGDSGSSGEGQNGTISELLAQNGIPTTVDICASRPSRSSAASTFSSSPKTDNQYHAAWAWAGNTPYKGMKLLASHLGGTRNPMVVSWPGHRPDARPRTVPPLQRPGADHLRDPRHHPAGRNGVEQQPLDGVSFAYTFDDHDAEGRLRTQYFEIMGSRSIYHDGWMASAFGPRSPWVPGMPPGILEWTPDQDTWELYHLDEDWTQSRDLADEHPDKLAELKEVFAIEAARNSVYPIGGGLWVPVFHPEMRISTPYREWSFTGDIVRMPEFCAPALGNRANTVDIDLECGDAASGVLYALGANSGGLTCYMDDGHLCYEYNLFILQRTKARSEAPLGAGRHSIRVETVYTEARPGGPLAVTLSVDGDVVATAAVPISAPLLFTANDCLDIGTCLGSPVSLDYFDRAPFPFDGTIHTVDVRYLT